MSLAFAGMKNYRLKLMVLALWALAIPAWLLAQHGGEMGGGMQSEHGGASREQLKIKERELRQSVHQKLDCSECHGETEMGIGKVDQVTTCARCHKQAFEAFLPSVHADSVRNGMPQAASCVACHGSHEVQAINNPPSPVSRMRVTEATCARCHESPTWKETHSIPPDPVADYRRSFHGLSAALGDRRAANCASCHSYHEILLSSDSRSTVNERNLITTCGACHAGATQTFATGGIHYNPAKTGFKVVDFVRAMYLMMIALTVSLMLVHNTIDFWGRLRERLARRRERLKKAVGEEWNLAPPAPPEGEAVIAPETKPAEKFEVGENPKYLRFTAAERIQHWTLAASFIVLALTGFALKYTWRIPFLEAQQGALFRGFLHRAAAVVFIALAIYHIFYMALTRRGRDNFRALVPRIRSARDFVCRCAACFRLGPPSAADWKNLIQTVKYNLGFAETLPAMGRFTYAEKMEYLALLWGSIVMITTGLILWFETPFLNRFQYWTIELATTVHYYEAVLATLSIIVWHFYYTIYNPHVFPLSRAMITGKISREEMERDHALELKMLEEDGSNKVEDFQK
jgi:cytochrome b subunit of formate dehydrogenase